MGIIDFVESVARDLRYALRGLARRPAFTFTAVLTLAVGIGASTAIFSVVYSVLIKPLPYPNSDELVSLKAAAPGVNIDDLGSDQTMLLEYRDRGRTFAGIGLWDQRSATLTDRGEATRVPILRVADGTLQTLGVQPLHGRWFTEQESYGPPAAGLQSVILSYAFWQRRVGGDETVLGREITMEAPSNAVSTPFAGQWQVVGIMPQGFRFLDITPQPDVIVPLRIEPATAEIGNFSFRMLARLEPGVTAAAAHEDIERILPIWLDTRSDADIRDQLPGWQITSIVRPLKDDLVGSVASA